MSTSGERTLSDEVVGRGPCECGSDKGKIEYADGHAYCYACGTLTRPKNGSEQPALGKPAGPHAPVGLLPVGSFDPSRLFTKRGITADTMRRFGYFCATFGGKPVEVAPYYDMQGNLVAQKLRFQDKTFKVLKASDDSPPLGKCQLFGRQVFGDKHDKRIVVLEGEHDDMAAAQAVDFRFPCVSVGSGAQGAEGSLRENYLWLDRFEEIILWFDADEPGRAAVARCAPLFAVGKVKVVRL